MSDAERAGAVVIGGAIMGSAAATFLAMRPDWHGRIVVVERDLTYRTSSTTLSAASIRLQFSTPLNIELSRFGVHLIKHLDDLLGVPGQRAPEVDFVERGYLFLATAAGVPVLEHNHAVQREAGVEVALLSPAELRTRFPWMTVDDLAAGSLGLGNEGWFDAYALLQAFRAKARSLGVEYLTGEAVAIEYDDAVRAVRLADGRRIETDWVVNAAGPRAAGVAAMVGTDLPVRPRKRNVYHFECRATLADAPLTIDPSGIYFRPEGPNWISGFSPRAADPDPDTFDLDVDRAAWEAKVWPVLAHRVEAFGAIRLLDAWAGHYEVNTVDHNAVVGAHPTLPNFLFANGFSGHGLQQAPAVGRGLAEWIVTGGWETLDLSPFGFDRIAGNRPIRELNVV